MELSHEFTVPVPVEEAWAHFQDIASVGECFPGAQVTSVEGDTFNGSVKVKLGPIALVYNGTGTFTEKDETAHRFVVDAKGKDKRGNGTAGATVTLAMTDNAGETDVKVDTDLAITGKPAQVGRGVMQDVSDKLLNQFVDCLQQRMGSGPVAEAPTASLDSSGSTAAFAAAAPEATPDPAAPAPGAAETPTETRDPAAPDPTLTDTPVAPAAASAPGAGGSSAATSAPRPRAVPTPAASPDSGDALDLGATVLPVLARTYWKQAVGAVVAIGVVVWIVRR
jgi:carbon monoxide dehydrogenase subunit G